jgi:hypothetical protein
MPSAPPLPDMKRSPVMKKPWSTTKAPVVMTGAFVL